jgi:hypothetical protein
MKTIGIQADKTLLWNILIPPSPNKSYTHSIVGTERRAINPPQINKGFGPGTKALCLWQVIAVDQMQALRRERLWIPSRRL